MKVIKFNHDEITDTEALKEAEKLEAATTAIFLGLGFGAAVVKLLGDVGAALPEKWREVLILGTAIYGTIQVPRLRHMSSLSRLLLMMLHSGMLLLYLPEMTSYYVTVASFALGALFLTSMVNAYAEDRLAGDIPAVKGRLREHGIQMGMYGGLFGLMLYLV